MPKTRKILVVEPERDVGAVLRAVFEQAGFKPVCLRDSTEALRRLERESFGFALVEVFLPRMGGLHLAGELDRRGIPLLMMTGHPTGMALLDDHVYPCLYKPFRLKILLSSMEEIMAAHRRGCIDAEGIHAL
ncbi:MAG TPA: response regulator [Stellaceae bacterium]